MTNPSKIIHAGNGIDISKATFDVALLNNNKVKTKKFNNQTMKQLAKCRKCKNKNTKQCDFLKYIEFSGAEI